MARQANRKKPIIPKAYPIDLREWLVRAVEGGMSARKAARWLMIDYSSALKWMGQFRRTGQAQVLAVQSRRKHCVRPVENHWG
jgi:transposase